MFILGTLLSGRVILMFKSGRHKTIFFDFYCISVGTCFLLAKTPKPGTLNASL